MIAFACVYFLSYTKRGALLNRARFSLRCRMKERGVPMNLQTYNLLLDILADTGDDSAFRAYEEMEAASWGFCYSALVPANH